MTLAPAHIQSPIEYAPRVRTYQAPPDTTPETPVAESLPAFLSRIGITGSAYQMLMADDDLLADPAPALAWWWYALAHEGVRQPAVLTFNCLAKNDPPPARFLALARTWHQVTTADRAQIEEQIQGSFSCDGLADRWCKTYPGLTAGAFVAFLWIYAIAPAELGYLRAKGAWAHIPLGSQGRSPTSI